MEGSIIATAISTQQLNLYFLISSSGIVYVRYIKSGSCLSAAKLFLKAEKIIAPTLIVVKHMVIIIPNKYESNNVEIYDIKNILKLKQTSPFGLQAKIPDLEAYSEDIKTNRFKENSILLTQRVEKKVIVYLLGIKLDEESDSNSWFKLPWILIMFGVAIVYNLVFRKGNTKSSVRNSFNNKQSTEYKSYAGKDLNKSWKAGKAAFNAGKKAKYK